MMETARTTWSPWRAWTAIALVLVTLALVQACGESSKHTGPTSSASLQLKLRRAGGAELPAGCTGTYAVTGPGVNIQNAALPADGHISFQGQLGHEYTVTVNLNCPGVGALAGSVVITVPPGGTKGEVVINVSRVLGVACNPSTVGPGESSTCKCDVQTVNAASITWTGVNSTSATATFSNQNPGTYTVSCTINGIDTRSTTVTVKAPEPPPPPPPPPATGSIQIFNNTEGILLRPKGLAEHLGCCPIWTRVLGIGGTTRQIQDGHSATVPAPPGNQLVQASCNASFDGIADESLVNVILNQTVNVFFFVCQD
jgi:hypothetical protein